jgi:nitrate/TMAO reductase-like tetraheme cytochrome c subunit
MDLNNNSGEMCGSCHSMQPQYLTWAASSHNRVGCAECHADTGIDGNVQMMKDLARYTYREVTNTYFTPIRLFTKVEDERCLRCHNTDRTVSSMGDIYIPHKAHYDRNVRCESCHKSVAHGGIARRGETKLGGIGWTEDRAVTAMVWENTATTMDECMQCHFRRKVTTECKSCHTGLNLPDYHKPADFHFNHGTPSRTILGECNVCHGYAGTKKMEVDETTQVRDYSRQNTFCKSCHSSRPVTHTTSWPGQHGQVSERKGQEGCMVCHDNRSTEGLLPPRFNCGSCHPSTHRKGFKQSHYPALAESTRPEYSCYNCHPQNRCISCHGTN